MTLDEIIILLNAGYSKEEIQALNTQPEAPEPETPETPAADPEPETPAADPEPETPPAPDYGAMIGQLTQQISSLTKAVQLANLRGTNLPEVKTETAEDVLAKLINPTYKADK